MGHSDDPVPIDHERSWQLPDTTDGAARQVTAHYRAGELQPRCRAVDLLERPIHQAVGGVGGAVGVGENWKRDRQVLPELTGVARGALTDSGDGDALGLERGEVVTQGGDLVPAERATELPKEDKDQRAGDTDPQIGEMRPASHIIMQEDITGGIPGDGGHILEWGLYLETQRRHKDLASSYEGAWNRKRIVSDGSQI